MSLSVFSTYWEFSRHPIHWLRDKLKGFKYAWQRATKGYCEADTWEMFDWYLHVIPSMLTELAENGVAYPTSYDDRLEWCRKLLDLADAIAQLQEEKWDKEHANPYLEDFEEACMSRYKNQSTSEEYKRIDSLFYKKIASLFMEEEKKRTAQWESLYKKAMQELIEILPECWD